MAEYVGSRPRGGSAGVYRSVASLHHPSVVSDTAVPSMVPHIRSEPSTPSYPNDFRGVIELTIERGPPELQRHALAVRDRLDQGGLGQVNTLGGFLTTMLRNSHAQMLSTGGVVGINDYGIKGRRQYAAERRRLLDLYVIVLNNADIRTATIHLRNEIFRRGIELIPAFDYKCPKCETEYSKQDAKEQQFVCPECNEPMHPPDKNQIKAFRKLSKRCNYFGQSFEQLLRETEDDVNIVDDAFLYLRNQYTIDELTYRYAVSDPMSEAYAPKVDVKQIFRLDPTLVEMDLDARGIPGMAHHACIFHRDVLLDIPFDENWDVEWKGVCPQCGLRTYPIYYKYSEQQAGSFGARRPEVLYLFENEVIHWSKFSPSETYGFAPVLSFYEKALTLIGMDRYLYDYFYERRVPQGIIAAYTDDPDGLTRQKEDVEAKMQRDPHYIPWIAVSARTQQGKIEFVRFAYSLEELDYLPVRDEIRERIAAMYGVSQIWMSSTEGLGGLSSESVPGDSPIWTRQDGFIDCIPIGMLMQGKNTKRESFGDLEVLAGDGWTKPRAVWRQMTDKPVFTFRTGEGIVRATGLHSMILDGGRVVDADKIEVGDRFVRADPPVPGQHTTLTCEEAWLLGFFAAEGHVTQDRVAFYNTDDVLADRATDSIRQVYGYEPKQYSYTSPKSTKPCRRVEIQNRRIAAQYIDEATATYHEHHTAWNKEEKRATAQHRKLSYKKVPKRILNADPRIQEAYLRGYQDGDGHIRVDGPIVQDTVDFVLAAGLQYLYLCNEMPTATGFRQTGKANQNPIYQLRTLLATRHDRRNEAQTVVDIQRDDGWHNYVYDIETESGTFVSGLGFIVVHNSQQLVVMSRAVEGGQRIYNSTVFPRIMDMLGITDWYAELKTPELTAELTAVQIQQVEATLAQTMIGAGFGARYDADTKKFSYYGAVPSQEEQQQEQQELAAQNPYSQESVQNAVLHKSKTDRMRHELRILAALKGYQTNGHHTPS